LLSDFAFPSSNIFSRSPRIPLALLEMLFAKSPSLSFMPVSSSYYNILKLDKDEYWYYFENGGDRHEFRLVKK
jgi:hypothetical protein